LIRRHDQCVQAFGDRVQTVTRRCLLHCRIVRFGETGRRLQGAIQPFGDKALADRLAVEFEAHVVETRRAQPLVDHVEGGHFFGDEQNGLSIMHGRRDDVRDCL
jgi:hypothetical protein